MDRKNQKPKRQKKSDRILHSGQTQNQIMTDYAVAPFDRKAEEMDEKWGIDRLVELVSAETAAKYGSAMAKFNDAIDAGDPSVTAARAQVCIRGMEAMDAEAAAAGAQRASMDVWEVEVAGELYGVMRDARSWQAIKAQRPEMTLVSLREVALALKYWRGSIAGEFERSVKESFGDGAEVVAVTNRNLEDEIPF